MQTPLCGGLLAQQQIQHVQVDPPHCASPCPPTPSPLSAVLQVLAVFEHTPEGFGYERVCPSTFQPLTGPQELRNYMQHHSFVGAPKGKHILTD